MSMYKTIFWSDEYADYTAGQSVQLTNGEALVYGESAFSNLNEAVAAAGTGVVIKVVSGKYDSYVVVNNGAADENSFAVSQVVAIDFDGNEDVAASNFTAEQQSEIMAKLNGGADGTLFVAADATKSADSTIYINSGEAAITAADGGNAVVSGTSADEIAAVVGSINRIETTAATSDLLVSNEYTNDSANGKFSNYAGAYAYATANNTSATIVVEKTNTLSGNTFDNNHKNYSGISVVIKDGASVGDALSKWDMTYKVTVEAGGKIEMARSKSASVSNIHIKNALTIGEAGEGKKTAYLDLLSDSYQDGDISIRFNGRLVANNAEIEVQDLDAQGAMTLTDTKLTVDGALSTATFFATTLTRVDATIAGTQISGGLSDFAGGTANQLGNVTMTDSNVTFTSGTVKVAANVKVFGNSTLKAKDLVINTGKTLTVDSSSTITAETLDIAGTGKIQINMLDGFTGGKIIDITGATGLTDDILSKIAINNTEYGAYIQDGDVFVAKNQTITDGAEDKTEITGNIVGNDVTITNSKEMAVTGSIEAKGDATITNATTEGEAEGKLNGGYDDDGKELAAKISAENNIILQNDGHANVDLDAKTIIVANNSKNTLIGNIGTADTENVIIADGTATADGVLVDGNGVVDGAIKDATITADVIQIAGQELTGATTLDGWTLITGDSTFGNGDTVADTITAVDKTTKVVNGATLTIEKDATLNNAGYLLAGDSNYGADFLDVGGDFDKAGGKIVIEGTVNTAQTNANGGGEITVAEGGLLKSGEVCVENGNIADAASGVLSVDGTLNTASLRVFNGGMVNVSGTVNADHTDYPIGTTGYTVIDVWGEGSSLNIDGTVNVKDDMKIQSGATLNITGGTLDVDYTLANTGTINVSGESDVKANVTGNGWVYMDGVTLDADTKLTGAKVRFASQENTLDGATVSGSFFQVGVGGYNGVDTRVDTANGVTVNVKNDAVIGSGGSTYAGWIGTGFYDTDAEKAAVMTDARYTLNIDNSQASFGYMHVSQDGILNVNGHTSDGNKYSYDGSTVDFYAGDFIINGTATFDGSDAWGKLVKVSCDNGTDTPGKLVIKDGAHFEASRHNGAVTGTALKIYKTGIVEVDNAYLEVGNAAEISADGQLNVNDGELEVRGTLTNNGTFTVGGESTVNIAAVAAGSNDIELSEGTILKDSTIMGDVGITGNVTFRGKNVLNNMYDFGEYGAYGNTDWAKWTVEAGSQLFLEQSVTGLGDNLYGVGYGDTVVINGNLTDADAARAAGLTKDDASFYSRTGVRFSSGAGWATSSFTVNNAYVILGTDGSFSNSASNGGSHEITFNNAVVDAAQFYFSESSATFDMSITDSNINAVIFMTADTDSVYTLTGSKVVTTGSGNDRYNGNAGALTITDSEITVQTGSYKNSGTITFTDSTLTAASVANTGTINLTVTAEKLATVGNDAYYIINQTGSGAALNNKVTIAGTEYSIGDTFSVGDVVYTVTNGDGNDIAISAQATVLTVDSDAQANGFNLFNTAKDALTYANANGGAVININEMTANDPQNVEFALTNAGTYTVTGGTGALFTPVVVNGKDVELNFSNAFVTLGKLRGGKDASDVYQHNSINVTNSVIASTTYGGYGGGWATFYDCDVTINDSIYGINLSKYSNAQELPRSAEDVKAAIAAGEYTLASGGGYNGQHIGTVGSLDIDDSTVFTGFFSVSDRGYADIDNSVIYVCGSLGVGDGTIAKANDSNNSGWASTSADGYRVGEAATMDITDSIVRNITLNGEGGGLQVGGNSKAGVLNITNSEFDFTAQGETSDYAAVYANGTVNIADSVFKAGTLENNGTFTANDSTVTAGTFQQYSATGAVFNDVDMDVTNFKNGVKDAGAYAIIGGNSKVQIDNLSGDRLHFADGTVLKDGTSIKGTTSTRSLGDITFGENENDQIHVDSFANNGTSAYDGTITVNGTLSISDNGDDKKSSVYWMGIHGSESGTLLTSETGNGVINSSAFWNIFQYGKITVDEGVTINIADANSRDLRFTLTDITIKGEINSIGNNNKLNAIQTSTVTLTGENAALNLDGYLLVGYQTYKGNNDTTDMYKSTVTVEGGAALNVDGALYINKDSSILVDADSTFSAGSIFNDGGMINSTNAGEIVIDRTMTIAGTVSTDTLTINNDAAFTVGTISVNNLNLAIGSSLTLTGTNSSVTGTVTVTGDLVPANAEFTLVTSNWNSAFGGGKIMYKGSEYTVKEDITGLTGLNFVVVDGNLYVKEFGAAPSSLYIGEFPAVTDPAITDTDNSGTISNGDKFTFNGLTYTIGENAFATMDEALASDTFTNTDGTANQAALDSVTAVSLGSGDHVSDIAENFNNISTIDILENAEVVDTAASEFDNDLVINNYGHLEADITTVGTIDFVNTSSETLLGSYSAEAINGTNTGAMAGSYTANDEIIIDNTNGTIGGTTGHTDFDAATVAITGGDASDVSVKAGALELTDTNTFGLNADSDILSGSNNIWNPAAGGNILLNGSANISIDGDNAAIGATIEAVDHTGTVTFNGEQTYTGDMAANKFVVAETSDVTVDSVQFDFNELAIAGTLNTDFTSQSTATDGGAITGTGILNTTHSGNWIINDSVSRNFSGFTGSVNMSEANAGIVMGKGNATAADAADATRSYFADGTTVTAAAGQNIYLAGNGVTTGINFTGAGSINVGAFDGALADVSTGFTQTLNGTNGSFAGTVNVSEEGTLTLQSNIGGAIDLDAKADTGNATTLVLDAADLALTATVKGDANDIIDVNQNASLETAGALNSFAGTVDIDDNKLTINGANTTDAEIKGYTAAQLNVNANTTLKADNVNFDGTLNINTANTSVQLDGDFGTANGNSVIAFNANNTELRIWDEKTVVVNSTLDSDSVTGELIYNWYSDLTLAADGALDNYDGEIRIAASATYPGKVTLKGDNVTDAFFTTVNYTLNAEIALDGGNLTLTNSDALKDYTGKVNVGKDTLTFNADDESWTTALFHGDAEAVINVNSDTRLFGTTSGQVAASHYSGNDAITNFNGTINIADGKELALQGNNTTNATVTGTAGSKLTIANASNNGVAVTNTFNSEDAISNFAGTIALGKNKLVLNADNTTAATITGNSSSTITAGPASKQEFTGNTSSFRGLFDIASGAEVELSGTIADTINAQGDTLTLSNATGKDVTVNAGTGSDLDNLAFGANNITLGAGDGDDFTNVTGSGNIVDFGQDQTFGTVTAAAINVTGSQDQLSIDTLTADVNITVDAAQAAGALADVTVNTAFTGDINVSVNDGSYVEGGYKLATYAGFNTDSTITLSVAGSAGETVKVDELVLIDGKAYLLQLKDNTLVLTKMHGYSNYVAVDGDWSGKVPYQAVTDGTSERIIGYDAAASLDKAVEYIKGYDTGINANAGTNPGDATIELTAGSYKLTTGTLMTDTNGVTQLVLKGRNGESVTVSGTLRGSDGSEATELVLENVRTTGYVFAGGDLTINNSASVRNSGNAIAAGIANESAAAALTMANDSKLTINGGYFTTNVLTGGSVAFGGDVTVTGSTSVVIDNQSGEALTITGNIFGGSYAALGNVTQSGDAYVTINVEEATKLRGNIYVSGFQSAQGTLAMSGNSYVTFSGDAGKLTFTGTVSAIQSAKDEIATFDNFDGKFNGTLSGFDSIVVTGDTNLELGRRQTQTANTAMTFDITGRFGAMSSVANTAMYTVRDADSWEFSNNIVVNAAVNSYDGYDYVLVGNYAGDFNEFTYTVAGNSNYTIGEWVYDAAGAAYKLYVNSSNQLALKYVAAANNVNVTADTDNLEIANAKMLTVADGVTAKTTDALNLTEVTLGANASLEITSRNRKMATVTLGNNSTLTMDIDASNSGTMDDLNMQVANAGDTATVIWGENGNWDYASGYTVGEGVTLRTEKTVINGGNAVQVDGTLESDYFYMLDGDVNVTGTIVAKGDALQVKAGSTLNVEGGEIQAQTSINVWQGDAALNVNNGTINLTAGHIHLWDGACTADFTNSTIGYGADFIVGNSGNGVVMTVDNSVMNQSVASATAVSTINAGNRMIVSNGSEINLGTAGMAVNGTGLTSAPGAALEVYGSAINGNIAGNTANDAIAMDVDSILNGNVTGVETFDITGISGLTTDTNGVKAIAGSVDDILANATIEGQSKGADGLFQLAGLDNTIGTADDIWAGLAQDASGDTIVAWGTTKTFVSDSLTAFTDLNVGDTYTLVADTSDITADANKKSTTHGTLA